MSRPRTIDRATAARLAAALCLAGLAQAVLAPGVGAQAQEVPPPVTAEDLARSVTSYQPTNVTTYQLDGSVDTVESTREDDGDDVLSLDTDVLFAFGSAQLARPAVARVGELVADLPRRAAVRVVGHTDAIGDDAANLRLSRARARAVAEVVSAARGDLRLTTQGRGDSDPVAPDTRGGKDDPEGRALNRRVEIRYADPG